MPTPEPLSSLEQAFVDEMLVDENARLAAIRAGYDAIDVDMTLRELMFEPRITSAIERAKAQRSVRTKMSQDTVLHEMSLLSHSCLEHYVIDDDGNVSLAKGAPDGAMRALKSIKRKVSVRTDKETKATTRSVEVELTLWDKPNPLKLMGRQAGLFPDKVEHSGPGGGPIETSVTRVERVIVDPTNAPL